MLYQLKMEAHNVAGSTNADFTFVTLTKDGGGCPLFPTPLELVKISISSDPPPAGMENRINRNKFFVNEKIIITAIITVTIVICSSALMIICLKLRKFMHWPSFAPTLTHILTGQRKQHRKEINENLKKAEIQRDRYYATIHKAALHGDKIPGNFHQYSRKL